MKLLVIGSGGREHALAWKLAQSPRVQMVYVAPGNGGTATEPGLENVAITAIPALVEFARREKIQLTVVGPEAPLAEGVVDAFRDAGLKIFGPTRAAAQLEASKDFAKHFMTRHRIPTAQPPDLRAMRADAKAYVDEQGAPIVIKADGLAAGKGVVVASSLAQAHEAIDMMLLHRRLGDAGGRVVVEEFLAGEEASFIVMVDGEHALPLATSQDHKRLKDGDQGPEHRRHGRLLARARGDAEGPRARDARNHHARGAGHGEGRHALRRLPVRRPDDRSRTAIRRRWSSTAGWAIPRRSRSSCG